MQATTAYTPSWHASSGTACCGLFSAKVCNHRQKKRKALDEMAKKFFPKASLLISKRVYQNILYLQILPRWVRNLHKLFYCKTQEERREALKDVSRPHRFFAAATKKMRKSKTQVILSRKQQNKFSPPRLCRRQRRSSPLHDMQLTMNNLIHGQPISSENFSFSPVGTFYLVGSIMSFFRILLRSSLLCICLQHPQRL